MGLHSGTGRAAGRAPNIAIRCTHIVSGGPHPGFSDSGMNLYVRLSMVPASAGCPAYVHLQPLRRSMVPCMQPHNADLQQRTYAREGGAPSLGPAWLMAPFREQPDPLKAARLGQ